MIPIIYRKQDKESMAPQRDSHLPGRLENEQKSGAIFVDLLFSAGLTSCFGPENARIQPFWQML